MATRPITLIAGYAIAVAPFGTDPGPLHVAILADAGGTPGAEVVGGDVVVDPFITLSGVDVTGTSLTVGVRYWIELAPSNGPSPTISDPHFVLGLGDGFMSGQQPPSCWIYDGSGWAHGSDWDISAWVQDSNTFEGLYEQANDQSGGQLAFGYGAVAKIASPFVVGSTAAGIHIHGTF